MKDISARMKDNCLKPNMGKTEVLIFDKHTALCNDTWWPSELGPTPTLKGHARNLGIILDSKLSMKCQVNSVSSVCFHTLCMLCKFFMWLPISTRKTVTHALITSRLDYGNTLYTSTTTKLIQRLQMIQNAATTLILNLPKRNQYLKDLHWLPVQKRCHFKLLTHAYKAPHDQGPAYLNH